MTDREVPPIPTLPTAAAATLDTVKRARIADPPATANVMTGAAPANDAAVNVQSSPGVTPQQSSSQQDAVPSPSIAPTEPANDEVRYAPDRAGAQAKAGRVSRIEKHQRRWMNDESYRNYSAFIGRTYFNPDVYTVWPWRPRG